MVRRRMCQSTKTKQRTQTLIEILGQHRYIKIQRLIKDIKLVKVKRVASLKCNGDVCGTAFHQSLPQQVRKLYFETTLLQAFENYDVERLQRVDWDVLIDEAESNLSAFKQWEHSTS
jgi:hypothetical protein